MLGDALRKRLKVYEPTRCKSYKELIQWLNETTETNTQKLAREVLIRLPKLGKDVPKELKRRWMVRQIERCQSLM